MTIEQSEIVPRILRDMNDGVLVVDMGGRIIYMNDPGCDMLGVDQSVFGKNYSRVFLDNETDEVNDGLHQFVLDAVYDKGHTHIGEVSYRTRNGGQKFFRLTSSFLYGEDDHKKIGIVLVFSDVSEVPKLNLQRKGASTTFSVLVICVCGNYSVMAKTVV